MKKESEAMTWVSTTTESGITPIEELLEREVRPHAEMLVKLHPADTIGLVVSPDLPLEMRRRIGGTEDSTGFVLSKSHRRGMAADHRAAGDSTTARWLTSKRPGRILYISGAGGMLLLNYSPGAGFEIEPGSLDDEWKS